MAKPSLPTFLVVLGLVIIGGLMVSEPAGLVEMAGGLFMFVAGVLWGLDAPESVRRFTVGRFNRGDSA